MDGQGSFLLCTVEPGEEGGDWAESLVPEGGWDVDWVVFLGGIPARVSEMCSWECSWECSRIEECTVQ